MNNKLLRINLTNETTAVEEIPESVVYDYMGGTGYITYYLYKELSPRIEPLSVENKIIIAPSIISRKSSIHPEIRFSGYDLIIIEGKSNKPVYVSIKDSSVEFKDASDLWGKYVNQTEKLIQEKEGEMSWNMWIF